jgi:hypothetical protein
VAEEYLVKNTAGDGTEVALVQEYNGPKSRLFLQVRRGGDLKRVQVRDDHEGRTLVSDARANPAKYLNPPAEPEPVVASEPEPVTAAPSPKPKAKKAKS